MITTFLHLQFTGSSGLFAHGVAVVYTTPTNYLECEVRDETKAETSLKERYGEGVYCKSSLPSIWMTTHGNGL